MNIVFCVPGFSSDRLRLQPWLSFYRIGLSLVERGHSVTVVTDMRNAETVANVKVVSVQGLRGTNSNEVISVISELSPDVLVTPVTPLSLISQKWLSRVKGCRLYAYISYPFYRYAEIAKALSFLDLKDKREFARHLLIPAWLWTRSLKKQFSGALCQSESTAERVRHLAGREFDVSEVLPGIDLDKWFPEKSGHEQAPYMLFVGSPYAIRGFNVLMDALAMVKNERIRLKVLARGADQQTLGYIHASIRSRSIESRVEVSGGWADIQQLRREISGAVAVVLPFVLVPSELPVSVMESIACGTPVITTDIDGLPSTTGGAGLVIPHADPVALAEAMDNLWSDGALRNKTSQECIRRRSEYPSWDDASIAWERMFKS